MYRSHINALTSSWGRKWCSLLVLFAIMVVGLVHPAAAATTDSRVLPQLQEMAAKEPTKAFRLVVTRVNRSTKADSKVQSLGGAKVKELKAESFVATLAGSKIAELGKDPAVKFVAPDAEMIKLASVDNSKLATMYSNVINAAGLWNPSSGSAITGAGIGVAVLDTGVQNTLGDWKNASGVSRIGTQILFNSNTKSMADGHGHGTHVAGIVGGNSWYSTTTAARGKYIGVAPEAKIINVKVSDDAGMSYISDVVNAIDWVIANRTTHNIRVMNMSLISSVAESHKTSVLAAAVERAWFNGILVVVAAGNNGPDTMKYPPANDPFVITVGAADPMGTVQPFDDSMAPWSSYGTTQDGFTKPDVVAPGRYMVSTLASGGSTLAKTMPDRLVDTSYLRLSGTSMAAPVVAGIAALAFQAHPEWTNDQVKWLLMNTALVLGTTTTTSSTDPITGAVTTASTFNGLPGQGAGQIDAEAVVRYVGTPGYANQGLTISEHLTTADGTVAYNSASWSTASWSTASWSTASWSTASWSTASWSTSNWSTASWSTASWSTNSRFE